MPLILKLKNRFFLTINGGCPLIRACSLIRSNTVTVRHNITMLASVEWNMCVGYVVIESVSDGVFAATADSCTSLLKLARLQQYL